MSLTDVREWEGVADSLAGQAILESLLSKASSSKLSSMLARSVQTILTARRRYACPSRESPRRCSSRESLSPGRPSPRRSHRRRRPRSGQRHLSQAHPRSPDAAASHLNRNAHQLVPPSSPPSLVHPPCAGLVQPSHAVRPASVRIYPPDACLPRPETGLSDGYLAAEESRQRVFCSRPVHHCRRAVR